MKAYLIIVSAPSGAGKTTICSAILKKFPFIFYSVSYTTRLPRKNEENGKDYFFISTEEFQKKIQEGKWLEWALVHNNYYGTSKEFIDKKLKENQSVMLDIDVQGAKKVFQEYDNILSFFIMPPSLGELRKRLLMRATDKIEVIEKRLENAKKEIEFNHLYQHIIINDNLEKAIDNFSNILIQKGFK